MKTKKNIWERGMGGSYKKGRFWDTRYFGTIAARRRSSMLVGQTQNTDMGSYFLYSVKL